MKKTIRCLAMLLALAMLLPLWPQALAAEQPGEDSAVYFLETAPVAAPMADPEIPGDYPLPEDGYDKEVDGFCFRVGSDYAVLTEYIGDQAVVEVPATVDGVPVVRIGPGAFEHDPDIVELYLPEGLKYIDERAFKSCEYLHYVALPASLVGLGEWAFVACTNLNFVYIPPESVLDCQSCAEHVFDAMMVLGFPGTAAEECAEAFHVPFMPVEEDR